MAGVPVRSSDPVANTGFSAAEGMAGLEVMQDDGSTAYGYCNAVDLTCINPMLVHMAGSRPQGHDEAAVQTDHPGSQQRHQQCHQPDVVDFRSPISSPGTAEPCRPFPFIVPPI